MASLSWPPGDSTPVGRTGRLSEEVAEVGESQADRPSPLVPLRTAADTAGEVARLLAKFEARDNAPDIVRAVANSERAFLLWVHAIDALLYRSVLPAADREAAILRMAAHCASRYEWDQHVPLARAAGLDEAAVAALADTTRGPVEELDPGPALAVALVDRVRRGEPVSDDHWAAARGQWGDDGAFDLVFTIAFWGGFVPLAIQMLRL
jgi:alkylhydroperoxidase family enzyme